MTEDSWRQIAGRAVDSEAYNLTPYPASGARKAEENDQMTEDSWRQIAGRAVDSEAYNLTPYPALTRKLTT